MLAPQSRPCAWRSQLALSSAVAPLLTVALATTATAIVRITDDHGGNMGAYWSRYMALRDTGEQIVIDGTCSSACTLVLAIVPHDRICVTATRRRASRISRPSGHQRSWDTNALEHLSKLNSAVDRPSWWTRPKDDLSFWSRALCDVSTMPPMTPKVAAIPPSELALHLIERTEVPTC